MKAEIEKLRSEMNRYKEAVGNTACNVCGSTATIGEMSREEQQLKLENALLRKEVPHIISYHIHGHLRPLKVDYRV